MNRPVKVLSVGTTILGNAVYHANLCASLAKSTRVQIVNRSVADYWDLRAKVLFATIGSSRWGIASYRYRAEWVMSEVARIGLQRDIRRVQPDVIHCHTQAHALRCHGIAQHIPLIVSMDATARRLQSLPAYSSQRSGLERVSRMEERLFKACVSLGGVSQWVIRSLEEDYGLSNNRLHLCSPCVNTDLFAPAPPSTRLASNRLRIAFVGNDLDRKGGHLLLELMADGLADFADLHIVSGADAQPQLPRGVTWHHGLKPGSPALIEQLQLADVFALPTYEDCFPQALIEAMACGIPLISTKVMGIPEIVRDGVNGFCIAPGDKRSLATALQSLAGSSEIRRQFAFNSRRMAEENFSFPSSRMKWENLFMQAATTAIPFAKN
jgi:glycosyltransferase involved in cell wall biosynthesis